MSTALEIYKSRHGDIEKSIRRGYKVFIAEDMLYFDQYKDKLKKYILSYRFDIPFDKVGLVNDFYSSSINKRTCSENYFSGTFCYSYDKYICFGEISIKRGAHTNVSERLYGYDKEQIICRNVLSDGIKQVEIVTTVEVFETNSNGLFVNRVVKPKTIRIGKYNIAELVSLGALDITMYFSELLGEDFEVKVIEPKTRTNKVNESNSYRNQPLFTIIRRPTTTVVVDLIPETQESHISDETISQRKPLEYGYKRRPHSRTYRHPRYINVRGQTIEINGTWVGPEKEKPTVYLVAKSKGE